MTSPGSSPTLTVGWESHPEPYRSVLLGLREELEAVPGIEAGPHLSNRAWAEQYWYGITVFEMPPRPERPRHVCNLYVHGSIVTLLRPGDCRPAAGAEFDLSDPDCLPRVVGAVRALVPVGVRS